MTATVGAATALLVCGLALQLLKISFYNIFFQAGIALILATPIVITALTAAVYLKNGQTKLAAIPISLFTVLAISIIGKLII